MRRFCYNCGALESKENPLIGGLCQRCLASRPLLHLPTLELVTCPKCGAVRIGGNWLNVGLEEGVKMLALSSIKVAILVGNTWEFVPLEHAKNVQVETEVKKEKSGLKAVAKATWKFSEERAELIQQQVIAEVRVKKELCRVCRLKSGGYYEAILQVRGGDTVTIRRILEEEATRANMEDARVFVTKIQEVSGGLDFYLSSVALARRLGKILKQRFGAELQESAKLVGQVGGRRRYRVSVLARLKST